MTFDRKQWSKEYYEKNKEAIAQYKKEWEKKNKESISKQGKEYYEKNKARIIECRKKNREVFVKYKREYNKKNKKRINEKNRIKVAEDTKNLKLTIGNKSRVEDLDCYYCGFNYEVWKKRNTNRPYIEYLTFEHIHSFFVVSQTFDKETMNNHPIYSVRCLSQQTHFLLKKLELSEEYLREYVSLSCDQCQRDNFYQDKLDIKNYQDGLDLEEKKQ